MSGQAEVKPEVGQVGRVIGAGRTAAATVRARRMVMEISKETAERAIKEGTAREVGTVTSDGWRWRVIERLDLQRTDHVRVERAE